MTTHIKPLTDATVARILRGDFPAGTFVRDPTLIGFGVRVGATRSAYIVESRIGKGGASTRTTIGTVGKLKLHDAKLDARDKLNALARGVDVVAVQRAAQAEAQAERARSLLTWKSALDSMNERRKLSALTLRDYTRAVVAADLEAKPLRDFTSADALKIFRDRGAAAAGSRTLRSLAAIYNAAREDDKTVPPFPSDRVKASNKKWRVTRRRQRVIPDALLADWWKAVQALHWDDVRDYIAFLVFTGCRSIEAKALQVRDVNLKAGVMIFRDTKTHRDLELPIVHQLRAALKRRIAAADEHGFLFSQSDVHGQWEATLQVAPWSPHDLRRMFVSSCHRLGIDEMVARALAGHATENDAHTGYVILPPDALRPHAQAVADFIERLLSSKVRRRERAA